MSIKKTSATTLDSWVDGLIDNRKVIGIQSKSDRFAFGPLASSADLRLDYDVAILPPKVLFQPPREGILTFEAGKGYESVVDSEPFVVLGVHPYDLVGLSQMDEIFSQVNPDIHYLERRNNGAIVAVDVQTVSPDVFAGFMGTAVVEGGFDVLLTKIGDEYIVDARTEKGESLIAGLADEPDAGESWLEQRRLVWDYNRQRLRKHDLSSEPSRWPQLLEDADEHPVWEEKARLCFSCGSCNLVCPTCYCFDVRDYMSWDLASGERVRLWDGCLLTSFATVAGNLNFRKDPADRYRHRYYRKGKYVPAKIGGQIACVGCGRCITACVANIANPVDVFNRLGEGK
jgi:ferredoxin